MGGRTRSSSRTRRLIDGFGSVPLPRRVNRQISHHQLSPDFRAFDAVALLFGALAHRREYGTRRHPSRSWIRRTSGQQTRSPAWHRENRSTQHRSARRAPPARSIELKKLIPELNSDINQTLRIDADALEAYRQEGKGLADAHQRSPAPIHAAAPQARAYVEYDLEMQKQLV